MSKESINKAVVGRWFTGFWGKQVNLAIIDEIAAPSMSRFIGRTVELQELQRFLKKKTASLVVVRSRRRMGKIRLIEEFARSYRFLSLIGQPPNDKTTRENEGRRTGCLEYATCVLILPAIDVMVPPPAEARIGSECGR